MLSQPESLSQLQSTLCRSLLGDPDFALAGMLLAHGAPAPERIRIHRNNIVIALTAALAANYPRTFQSMGEAGFDQAAEAFIRWRPPTTPGLSGYGDGFAEVAAAHPVTIADPFIADLARVEWALRCVARAAEPDARRGLRFADLQHADPAGVILHWHPAVAYVRTDWAIDHMLAAGDRSWPQLPSFGPAWLEIVRSDRVACFRLTPGNWTFRCCLAQGRSLMDAVREALLEDPLFDLLVALRSLVSDNTVTDVTILPTRSNKATS
jgi:hypothetical protein